MGPEGPKGTLGEKGEQGARGPKGEPGAALHALRNWKQCAWEYLNDEKDNGLIKVEMLFSAIVINTFKYLCA